MALLRLVERSWFAARGAVAGLRRDSHAAAAIDLLAAAPVLSATSLAELLGISIKNAIRLLDGFVGQGIVIGHAPRETPPLWSQTFGTHARGHGRAAPAAAPAPPG